LEQQIFSTAYDAMNLGYQCYIVEDLSCGKDIKKAENCLLFLKNMGVKIIKHNS